MEYLTTAEAAELMMCSRGHVLTLIRQNKLPTYKVGNRNLIPAEAVRDLISSNTFGTEMEDEK